MQEVLGLGYEWDTHNFAILYGTVAHIASEHIKHLFNFQRGRTFVMTPSKSKYLSIIMSIQNKRRINPLWYVWFRSQLNIAIWEEAINYQIGVCIKESGHDDGTTSHQKGND